MRAPQNPKHLLPALLAFAVVAVSTLSPGGARAAEDPREVTARTHFAKGEYRQALELFATLFAERNDPIYMRNIGRCHQKLGQPTHAIDAFREYLRRAPNLKPSEKQEIEGFIKEMEDLKASQALVPRSTTTPPAAAVEPPPTNVDLQPRPPVTQPDRPAVALTGSAPAPSDEARAPIYKRWWFWTAAGVVVAGAIVTGIALSAGTDTALGNCMGIPDCVRVQN
jgi:hypothetical protein